MSAESGHPSPRPGTGRLLRLVAGVLAWGLPWMHCQAFSLQPPDIRYVESQDGRWIVRLVPWERLLDPNAPRSGFRADPNDPMNGRIEWFRRKGDSFRRVATLETPVSHPFFVRHLVTDGGLLVELREGFDLRDAPAVVILGPRGQPKRVYLFRELMHGPLLEERERRYAAEAKDPLSISFGSPWLMDDPIVRQNPLAWAGELELRTSSDSRAIIDLHTLEPVILERTSSCPRELRRPAPDYGIRRRAMSTRDYTPPCESAIPAPSPSATSAGSPAVPARTPGPSNSPPPPAKKP